VTDTVGARATITVFGESVGAQIADGWVSRAYGKRESAPVAVFTAEGEGPRHLTTFIIPSSDRAIRLEEQKVDYPSAHAFRVVSGEVRDILVVSDGRGRIECGPVVGEGSVAWVRFEDDEFARAILVRGRLLEASDDFSFRSEETVHHCAIRRTDIGIKGSVNGGAPFELVPGEETREIDVPGARFEVFRKLAVNVSEGSRLGLIDNTSEATV